jgi:hypothetical protein
MRGATALRGVRSRMASSWGAICWSVRCWSVRSGAPALIPATSRTSRSSFCCGRSRSSRLASMMPSSANRRIVGAAVQPSKWVPARGSGPPRRHPGLIRTHLAHGRQPGIQPH